MSNDFPAAVKGHTLNDSEKTLAMGVQLLVMKKGATAFPSIPLLERDGLDMRVASNGRFIYMWAKGRLFAVSLDEIITGARFHLTGSTAPPPPAKPKAPPAPPPVKDDENFPTLDEIVLGLDEGDIF
jgi:hypothetical protein